MKQGQDDGVLLLHDQELDVSRLDVSHDLLALDVDDKLVDGG